MNSLESQIGIDKFYNICADKQLKDTSSSSIFLTIFLKMFS